MRRPDGFAPGSLLRISPGRKPEWAASELGYGEFNELLRTARKLITSARAIDADELNPPERSTSSGVDVVELEQRADGAEQSLRGTANDFQQQLATPDTRYPGSVTGIDSAVGRVRRGRRRAAFRCRRSTGRPPDAVAQAGSVQKEFAGGSSNSRRSPAVLTPAPRRLKSGAITRWRGCALSSAKRLSCLPRFTPANADELEKALADSAMVQDGDPLSSITWFQRMARVREGAARLDATLNYSEALKTGEKLKLTIAQLPYDAGDRWVGLPLETGKSLPGGKLSLAVQSAVPVDVRQPLAGLLIDEWVEVVPSATETTGISFQYDQPNSTPPANHSGRRAA